MIRRLNGDWPTGAKPANRTIDTDSQYRVTNVHSIPGGDAYTSPFAAEVCAGRSIPVPPQSFSSRYDNQQFTYNTPRKSAGAPSPPDQTVFDRGLSDVNNLATLPTSLTNCAERAPTGPTTWMCTTTPRATSWRSILQRPSARCLGPSQKCSPNAFGSAGMKLKTSASQECGVGTVQRLKACHRIRRPFRESRKYDRRYEYSGGRRESSMGFNGDINTDRFNSSTSFRAYDSGQTTFKMGTRTRTARALKRYILPPWAKSQSKKACLRTGSAHHVLKEIQEPSWILERSSIDYGHTSELAFLVPRVPNPNGATDYDYRPARWHSFREDRHFTGKEQDVETGLTYFGAR